MDKIKRIFGNIDMTWKKVIFFAIITGLYTGIINLIPFLNDTSFKDIAVTTEWWVLFAIIIASNCKKPLEAGLKIFVFFLISQPLVYLVETPFLGLQVWGYYKYWAIITVLTLPGGFIAYFINKKNIVGTLVLSIALVIVAMNGAEYMTKLIYAFPHHLLTVIFCIAQIIILIIVLIDQKRHQLMAFIISAGALVVMIYMGLTTTSSTEFYLPEGEHWVCTFEDEDEATLTVYDSSFVYTYNAASLKENTIHCVDDKGQELTFKVEVKSGTVNIIPVE